MRQFKRVFKPLLSTIVVGSGVYYVYDSIQTKNLEQTSDKRTFNTQNSSVNTYSHFGQKEQQYQNPQQDDNLGLQAIETPQNIQSSKTVKEQTSEPIPNSQAPENPNGSQALTSKTSEQTFPQPNTTEVPVSPKQRTSKSSSEQPAEKRGAMDLSKVKRLSELAELPFIPKDQLKTILIVADMGYTQQFQQKLLETIKNIKKVPNSGSIQVYRVNASDPQSVQQISKFYGHKIKEETIFLLKNQLEDNLIDISFDMFMQYPTLINTYLTKINLYNQSNHSEYMKKLQKMSPNESYLMFIYDDSQTPEKRAKALLAAKYVEMELALQHLDQAIKVIPVQVALARHYKLIPQDKIRPKSIHIIRKHNEFTHVPPNLYLNFDDQIGPYHLLPDIGLHNKRGEVMIQQYLQKIQTFNSLSITTPYLLSLTIDKNRVSTQNYNKLMETFKELKRQNRFPEVSIALKFAEVGYLGRNEPENNEFNIKMANVAELQNQSAIHQISNLQDAKNMGITQQSWVKNSYEFLYPHQAISEELIQGFIQKVLLNEVPQYYRSDKPSSIQNVHKVVASNFDQQILQNTQDHFVFEYSDHCPSCKLISPLIGYMNDILPLIPIQKRFNIHVMNCHKNRVKGQVYSPYTPNMNYFKNDWKHTGPVRIGLQTIKYGGLEGLYNFCIITNMLKTIDAKMFSQAIESAKGWKKSEFLL